MRELHGQKIVVTRPVHQAQHLIDGLTEHGAEVIPFPTIDIRFRQSPLTEAESLHLRHSSLWIFTSANAVTGAAQLGLFNTRAGAEIACIGRATATAFAAYQVKPDVIPEKNGDSESLLRILGDVSRHRSVIIIRGGQGREKLSVELQNQGVIVSALDVYDRTLTNPDADSLQRLTSVLPCTVCITSNQGLLNLLKLVPTEFHSHLLQSNLIVNSTRANDLAVEKGFRASILIASPPGDQGQLAAILQCNRH